MSVYTVQLGNLIYSGFDIGLDKYPIWDEEYRLTLNQKLVDHYWFREIGAETPALFSFFLNRTLNEIMPYYNELYKTTLYEYDPTNSYHLKDKFFRLYNSKDKSNIKANASGNSTTKNLFSDTPQGILQNGAIENMNYLTNATIINGGTKTDNSSDVQGEHNDDETHLKVTSGNIAQDVAALVKSYRDAIINIDMQIITDRQIEDCFMQLWNSP